MFASARMVAGVFVIGVGVIASVAHAQILPETASTNTTQVTVGTTTFDVEFERARLGNAQAQLQQILAALLQFDSEEALSNTQISDASTRPQSALGVIFPNTQRTSRTVSTSGTCYTFASDLKLGDRSVAVRELQKFLNFDNATQVAETGPGSPGRETNYFGPLTLEAVKRFQQQYRSDILDPLMLSQATGYWGAASREHANANIIAHRCNL